MTGERNFPRGGKNPHLCRIGGILWRQHKGGFAVAKFSGNLLHLPAAHPLRI